MYPHFSILLKIVTVWMILYVLLKQLLVTVTEIETARDIVSATVRARNLGITIVYW